MKVLCGTGHRPQDVPDGFNHSWKNEISIIQKFILDNDITKVITGMALGFDQALAIAVIKLKQQGHNIVLEAACPCVGQEKKWNEEYQKLYSWILSKCDIVTHVSKTYTPTCMQDRNKYMVDNSNIVLAYYNGKGYGGTYNCIQYAKEVGREVVNIYKKEEKDMRFTKMYVENNRELKKVHNNVVLNIRTRNTEDLLDINRQIWRLEKEGFRVILQSPKGKLLPSRALGKYTKEHVSIEIGGLSKTQIEAKLANLKYMMSHKEYVDIPVYEISNPSAFDYKTPKTDEDGNVVVETVEKIVYLNKQYTITVNGEYCHTKAVKKLAKSFKIPLATVIGNEVIDQNDESYLLDGYNDKSKEILNRKYEELSDNKKEILYEVFGIKEYKVSDYENYLYSTHNFVYFLKGELGLPRPVDAQKLLNVLETFKVDNAYDFLYDQAECGMLTHLEDFPLIQLLLDKWETETDVFYEDSYIKEDEDPLD